MGSCDSCLVRNRAICAALDAKELETLNAIGRRRELHAGESLIWEGEESILVANVIEGVLKLSTGTQDGREQIVGVVYPSEFFGRPFGTTSNHGVTALTDARVCVFSRRDFDAFARGHPALEHKLLERTLGELDRTRRWMLLLGRKSASEKIASFLLETADRLVEPGCKVHPDAHATRMTLPFSRQQIADVLGLTIETVSRQFSHLKHEGVIDLPSRRDVVILDREALVAEAG
ncbi:Crp/Fnr family transcriptional regulator [Novosphingobium album (ex Liu et al. 2023)]|uniref:Crp/Fnr family transcriptional regulator n=1 Tax=Novosphingobium album (ex Liu et al. 2023) TaxID=3031130 RepID=A0ABT5WN25_9SPHN|nr:Crp/Fnr family transcriptional regulator [Novosphingobium album (ex Liu et al. 2023)]MDE8651284.1 Crp/Fnr family transcriptional regulator [Novosphingobium album (ex Liu et al. 2023)]